LVRQPLERTGWVYEEKYDGYRILAYKEDRKITLSRNDKDRTDTVFATIVGFCALISEQLT